MLYFFCCLITCPYPNTVLNAELIQKSSVGHKHNTADVTDLSQASVSYANSAGSATNADHATSADNANAVAWNNVSGKPNSYTPSSHAHDDRYYTESETNNLLNGKSNTNHTHSYLPLSGGTMTGTLKFNFANSGQSHIFTNDDFIQWGPMSSSYFALAIVHDSGDGSSFRPSMSSGNDGHLYCGDSGHRWRAVYAASGSIQTSDRNMKNTIQSLDNKYLQLFSKLSPVSFKFNDGSSGRTHIGFIAQDVEEVMSEVGLTSLDFAGFCKDQKVIQVEKPVQVEIINESTGETEFQTVTTVEDTVVEGEYVYSLRYEEFIALNTAMIQNLIQRIESLEERLKNLEN